MKLEIRVILHNVRSVHNVGSIFRTADALGATRIYCAGITPTPTDRLGVLRPQFAKVALGAHMSVAWEGVKNVSRCIEHLKKEGFVIFAIEQNAHSIPYYKLRLGKKMNKICFVMGNEVKGIPLPVRKRADRILEIPMQGKKESLNVAVAFGIVAFHLRYHT